MLVDTTALRSCRKMILRAFDHDVQLIANTHRVSGQAHNIESSQEN